jgi:hypothetical protein
VFPGRLAPQHIQILIGPVPGRGCLQPLHLEEIYDIFAVSTGCLSGPQVYVEEHLAPAGDLPFQLDLQSVSLAQEETIDFLLGGFCARRSIEQAVDLAWGPLFWVVPLCFVFSHEKRLLSVCLPHPVSPVLWGRAQKKKATEEGDSKKRPHSPHTHDANGYQATSSLKRPLLFLSI